MFNQKEYRQVKEEEDLNYLKFELNKRRGREFDPLTDDFPYMHLDATFALTKVDKDFKIEHDTPDKKLDEYIRSHSSPNIVISRPFRLRFLYDLEEYDYMIEDSPFLSRGESTVLIKTLNESDWSFSMDINHKSQLYSQNYIGIKLFQHNPYGEARIYPKRE